MKRYTLALLLIFALLPLLANPAWDSVLTLRGNKKIEYNGGSVNFNDGSTIFTWSELNNGDRDIYAMRVLPNGLNGWEAPLLVSDRPGEQNYPIIVKISETDAIVIYYDFSPQVDSPNFIRAMRINTAAQLIWPQEVTIADGINESQHSLKAYLYEGSIFCFWDGIDAGIHIFGQKLSTNGTVHWGEPGIQFTDSLYYENLNAFIPIAPNQFALIYGARGVSQEYRIFLQRYNTDGTALNALPTIAVDTPNFFGFHDAVYDGEIKLLISKYYPSSDLMLVRFNSLLQHVSTPTMISSQIGGDVLTAKLVPTLDGEYFVMWDTYAYQGGLNSNLFSCRLSSLGQIVSPPTTLLALQGEQRNYRYISDGQNGVLCAWNSVGNAGNVYGLGALRYGTAMNLLWQFVDQHQGYANLQNFDIVNGYYRMAWNFVDVRNSGIGIQKISTSGAMHYATGGLRPVVGITGDAYQKSLKMFTNAENKLAIWVERRTDGPSAIYYQAFNAAGEALLEANGRFLGECDWEFDAIQTPSGDVAIVWYQSYDDVVRNIYAQMINPSGQCLWGTNNVLVLQSALPMRDRHVSYYDGAVICAWSMGIDLLSVYAQKIVDANLMWGDGILVSPVLGQTEFSLAGLEGPYVILNKVLVDEPGLSIGVIKLNGDGTPAWEPPYKQLMQSTNSMYTVQILNGSTIHNNDLYVIARQINEDFIMKSYVQGISSTGNLIGEPTGRAVFNNVNGEVADANIKSYGNYLALSAIFQSGTGSASLPWYSCSFDANLQPLWGDEDYITGFMGFPYNPEVSFLSGGVMYRAYVKMVNGYNEGLYHQLINPNGTILLSETPIWQDSEHYVGNVTTAAGGIVTYVAWDKYIPREYKSNWADSWDFTGIYVQKYDFSALDNQDNEISPAISGILAQNYPNPFNPCTNISYSILKSDVVTLEVFNLRGQKIKTLVNESKAVGNYSVTWDGTDNNGKAIGSGVYLYKLRSGKFSASKKMILMK